MPRSPLLIALSTPLLAAALLTGCSHERPGADPEAKEKNTTMHDKTLYDFDAVPFRAAAAKPLRAYEGQVLLVANIAANCGYTPQMKPLGALEKKYADKRFHVLGFLSDDFGRQAGSEDEVAACDLKYDAGFAQFAIVGVKMGPTQSPIFQWLTSRPGLEGDVKWNFAKWLVGRDGRVVKRWGSDALPDSAEVTAAIEAELAK